MLLSANLISTFWFTALCRQKTNTLNGELLTLSLIHMGAGLYYGYVIKDRYNVWTRMALRVHRD